MVSTFSKCYSQSMCVPERKKFWWGGGLYFNGSNSLMLGEKIMVNQKYIFLWKFI